MTDTKKAVAWLAELAARGRTVPMLNEAHRSPREGAAWLAEAQSALEAVFPTGHAVVRTWHSIFERAKAAKGWLAAHTYFAQYDQALGVIDTAVKLVAEGRLATLLQGLQLETVAEVLDQADVFASKGRVVAAAVLGGGALETHLAHLCDRNKIEPAERSISGYDQAIAQARNAGLLEVYGKSDSKAITDWGGIRNDAAHTPTTFTHSRERVEIMLAGIREFLARTS